MASIINRCATRAADSVGVLILINLGKTAWLHRPLFTRRLNFFLLTCYFLYIALGRSPQDRTALIVHLRASHITAMKVDHNSTDPSKDIRRPEIVAAIAQPRFAAFMAAVVSEQRHIATAPKVGLEREADGRIQAGRYGTCSGTCIHTHCTNHCLVYVHQSVSRYFWYQHQTLTFISEIF